MTSDELDLIALARAALDANAQLERLKAAAAHLERCGYVIACLDGGVMRAGTSSYDLMPDDIIEAAVDVGWDGKAGT
jgi:hypothetical protein